MTRMQHMIEPHLARHRGQAILSAPEAIAKAVLEFVPNVQVLSLVESPSLHDLIEHLQQPDIRDLLRMHHLRVLVNSDAPRAMERARWEARKEQHVIAVLAGDGVCDALGLLLHDEGKDICVPGAAIGCIIEDVLDPDGARSPATMAAGSEFPVIEASCVEHLRDAVEQGLRLSRADGTPSLTIVNPNVLASGSTLELRPNRSMEGAEGVDRRRSRAPRWTESGGALRMARRLELNTHRALPSPGDPSPVGFITVGPAEASLRQLAAILGMTGRIPALHLGLIQPLDDSAVERILSRCLRVIVLEPHPGLVEARILRCAERIRSGNADLRLAAIHGRELPPTPDGETVTMAGIADLHPSRLARKISHLLESLHSSPFKQGQLIDPPPPVPEELSATLPVLGDRAQEHAVADIALQLFESVTEEGDLLLEADASEDEDDASTTQPIRVQFQGMTAGPGDGRIVHLETWTHHRFERFGSTAIREGSAERATRILLVAQAHKLHDLERKARSAVPPGASGNVLFRRANLSERDRLPAILRELVLSQGLGVLLLEDGPPVQYDINFIESSLADIDRQGFQSMQRLIWPAGRACVIRQPLQQAEHEVVAARQAMPAETTSSASTLTHRWPPRFSGRIRPLLEQVEVLRTRAPNRHGEDVASKLPVPAAKHGEHGTWRVHLAGLRGSPPGAAMRLLEAAGEAMDYHVQWTTRRTPIGAGRRAWSQLVYTRGGEDATNLHVDPQVPHGEADLLLGFDRGATLRAVGSDCDLRVASPGRTSAVINTGLFEDQLDLEQAGEDIGLLADYLKDQLAEGSNIFEDFSDGCRYRFHNERLADIAQVGTAFQLGLIPVTVDAMIRATRELESRGFARTIEAFEFGRRIAEDPSSLRRPGDDPLDEDADRLVRRFGHSLRRSGPGHLERAARFRRLIQRALVATPDLGDSPEGLASRKDLVIAIRRCLSWGGYDEAERLVDLVTNLYQADQAEHGHLLTRLAILPIAESMLIRDAIYMASMAVGPEHRRRTRMRLNIKRGRGDRIERRYVTRFELVFIRWRFRIDLRTSDWATKMLALARHVVPRAWRGTRRERDVRIAVRDLVQAAALNMDQYEHWTAIFQELHEMALDGRLRQANAALVRNLDQD